MILRSTYSFLIFFLVSGCAVLTGIDVSDIKHLEMEIPDDQAINHGRVITVNYYAITTKNKRKRLNAKSGIKVDCPAIEQVMWNRLRIIERPEQFANQTYDVTLSIQGESKTIKEKVPLKLNYKGNLIINAEGGFGKKGFDGDSGGQTLFGRDGTQGRTGNVGEDGENGDHYTIHIWKDGYEYRVRIEDDSTGVVWKYKSLECDSIILYINGGFGGDGGRGGDGGSGKPGKVSEKKFKVPGNGGKGGTGGNGGKGGNGGSALIFVHTNARKMANRIRIENYGGLGGEAGQPGRGGLPGEPAKGQDPAEHGAIGISGSNGEKGVDGPNPVISIHAFDFSRLADD